MGKKEDLRDKAQDKFLKTNDLKSCPRCGRKMSWFENEDGSIGQWCYYDQAHLLDPKLNFFK